MQIHIIDELLNWFINQRIIRKLKLGFRMCGDPCWVSGLVCFQKSNLDFGCVGVLIFAQPKSKLGLQKIILPNPQIDISLFSWYRLQSKLLICHNKLLTCLPYPQSVWISLSVHQYIIEDFYHQVCKSMRLIWFWLREWGNYTCTTPTIAAEVMRLDSCSFTEI